MAKILLLIGAFGILAFFLISTLAPFRNNLFSNLFPKYSSNASGDPSLSLSSAVSVGAGQTFTTPVMLNTDGNDVISADVAISFDKNILELTDITVYPQNSTLKDFLPVDNSVNPAMFGKNQIIAESKTNGVISFGVLGDGAGPNIVTFNGILDESKPLATLQFKALTATPTTVNLDYTPNSTNDSNIIRWDATDILSKVNNLSVNGGSSNSPAPSVSQPKQVSIADFAFSPNNLTVNIGDTVIWTNNDSFPHTVTATDGSFNSGSLSPGQTFSHTFTQAGTFGYKCNFHPSMTANITISTTVFPQPSGSIKPGDIDGNNKVDIFDYNQLLTDFGKQLPNLPADIDKSGKVDIFDYNILLTNFGK